MPWSGAGTYSLPPAYSPEVNGTTVDAVRYNGLTSDVASGITAALAKNGENVPTANLPMGGFKHTGAADASATGQYIAFNQATAVGSLTITALTVTSATGERFIVTGSTVPANGIYLSAANTLAFASNATARGAVNSTGNWTINAPNSGIALSVAGLATATTAVSVIGGNSATGRVFDFIGADRTWSLCQGGTLGGGNGGIGFYDTFNNATRLTIGSSGNVTINAPIGGVTVAVNGISGNNHQTWSDGTVALGLQTSSGTTGWFGTTTNHQLNLFTNNTQKFSITNDGRVFGTSLHNNAGAVTGTTNQYIASGTYTPTLTNTTNVASSSFTNSPPAKWIRVGNVVQVSGHVTITPTAAAGTQTVLDLSLPIASNITHFEDCSGVASDGASGGGTANSSAAIQGSVADNRAQIVYAANNTNSKIFAFNFSYTVL